MSELTDRERGFGLALLDYHQARERAESRLVLALTGLLERSPEEGPALKGQVQKRLVQIPGLAGRAGLTAGEIAKTISYDEANVYTVLASLEKADVLETVPDAQPRRWRLTLQHRRDRILRLSRLMPEGRWTTYGDFAIAVYGNVRMATTIGGVASRNLAFAHAHRVLESGGVVPKGWHDAEGRGPEECERRLGTEGITVADGRADLNRFIGWDELRDLLRADEAEKDLPEAA